MACHSGKSFEGMNSSRNESLSSGKKSGKRGEKTQSLQSVEKVVMKHKKDSVKSKPKVDYLKVSNGSGMKTRGKIQQSSSPIPGHSNDEMIDSPPISPLKASQTSLASSDGVLANKVPEYNSRQSNMIGQTKERSPVTGRALGSSKEGSPVIGRAVGSSKEGSPVIGRVMGNSKEGSPVIGRVMSNSKEGSPVIGRAVLNGLVSGSPPRRSRTASLTDSLTATDLSDIGASFDDLAATTGDSSPTLPRRMRGAQRDCSPLSVASVSSQSSFNYSVDSIKRRYKTELWSAIKSDYRYLMDDEIIETCKSTETDLSMDSDDCSYTATYTDAESLTYQHFVELYMQLSDWLHQTLERAPKKGQTRSEHHLNQILHKDLMQKAPSLQTFTSSAHSLMTHHPQLRADIRKQLCEVNKQWEELEGVVKSASGDIDQITVLKDVEADLVSHSQWILETEKKLKCLKILPTWTKEYLKSLLDEHRNIETQIKCYDHTITASLNLCQRLYNDSSVPTDVTDDVTMLNVEDIIRAVRCAEELRQRCYAVWILAKEWLIRLEECIKYGISQRKVSDRFIESSEEADEWDGRNHSTDGAGFTDIFGNESLSQKQCRDLSFYRGQNSGEEESSPTNCDTSDADTAGSLEDSPDFVGARRFRRADAIAINGRRLDRDHDADSALGRSFSDPSISDSVISGRKVNGLSSKIKSTKGLEPVISTSDLLSDTYEEMQNNSGRAVEDDGVITPAQHGNGMSKSVDALDDSFTQPCNGFLRRIETVDLKEAFILVMSENENDQGGTNKQEGSNDIGYSSENQSNEENEVQVVENITIDDSREFSRHCVMDGRITEEEEPLNESCDQVGVLNSITEEEPRDFPSISEKPLQSEVTRSSATSAYSSDVVQTNSRTASKSERFLDRRGSRLSARSAGDAATKTEDELSESMDLPLDDVPVVVYAPGTLVNGITVTMSRSLDSIAMSSDERFLSRVDRRVNKSNQGSQCVNSIREVNENVSPNTTPNASIDVKCCVELNNDDESNISFDGNDLSGSCSSFSCFIKTNDGLPLNGNRRNIGAAYCNGYLSSSYGSHLHGLNGKNYRRRKGRRNVQYSDAMSSCDASSEATSSGSEWNDLNTDDDGLTSDDQLGMQRRSFKSCGKKLNKKCEAKKRTRQESLTASSIVSSSDTECEDCDQSEDVVAKLRRVTPPPGGVAEDDWQEGTPRASRVCDSDRESAGNLCSTAKYDNNAEFMRRDITPTESMEDLLNLSSIDGSFGLSCALDYDMDDNEPASRSNLFKNSCDEKRMNYRKSAGGMLNGSSEKDLSGKLRESFEDSLDSSENPKIWNEERRMNLTEQCRRISETLFCMHVDHLDGKALHDPAEFDDLSIMCERGLNELNGSLKSLLSCGTRNKKSVKQAEDLQHRYTSLKNEIEINREESEELCSMYSKLVCLQKRLETITADLRMDMEHFSSAEQIQQTIDMMTNVQKDLEQIFVEFEELEQQKSEFGKNFPEVSLVELVDNIGPLRQAATILVMQCKEDVAKLQLALFSWQTIMTMEQELSSLLRQEKQQLDCLTAAHNVVRFTDRDSRQTCNELKTMQSGLGGYEEKVSTMCKLLEEMSGVCDPCVLAGFSKIVETIKSDLRALNDQCSQLVKEISTSSFKPQPIVTDTEAIVEAKPTLAAPAEPILMEVCVEPQPIKTKRSGVVQMKKSVRPKPRDNVQHSKLKIKSAAVANDLVAEPQLAVAEGPAARGRFAVLQKLLKYALPLPIAAALLLGGLYMIDPDGSLYNTLCGYGITIDPQLQYVRGAPPT